jgi:hypothetical protein
LYGKAALIPRTLVDRHTFAPAGKHVNLNDGVKGPNPLAELVEAITTVQDIFLYLSTGANVRPLSRYLRIMGFQDISAPNVGWSGKKQTP